MPNLADRPTFVRGHFFTPTWALDGEQMSRNFLLASLLGASVGLIAPMAGAEGDTGGGEEAYFGPAEVGIFTVSAGDFPVSSDLPGRITPTRIAEVRPRVGGIIVERVFEQGSLVAAGDVLFRIDPSTYLIAVEASKAGVARAEAALAEARQTETRLTALNERAISSQANLDEAVAARLRAEADLAAAKAELLRTEQELSFTEVRAPISGRIGRAMITEGALVLAGGAEVLTTIQQTDPVYADVVQPVSELLRMRQALREGKMTEIEPGVAQAVLLLDDGSLYPVSGRLLFSEASVDRASGQVTMRAEFANPDDLLLTGMFVRVAIEQAIQEGVITVPIQAVQRDPSGQAMLYVVSNENVAKLVPVELGRAIGSIVVVEGGIDIGARVIVDGLQKIGPEMPVIPVEWVDPNPETTASTDAPSAKE